MADKSVPTLYEWMGGMEANERLLSLFYARVPDDALLAPVFAHMSPSTASMSPRSSPRCSEDRRRTARVTAATPR
jgi:hypothetical protein